MTDCRFATETENKEIVRCSNIDVGTSNGCVLQCFCKVCQYFERNVKADFFAQTAQLLVKKARLGEITVAAKPCGGCGSVKRRETDVMQFVFPYWHRGANDDEIRWAVRSIEQNFQGKSKITVIGDKPPWYNGHYIPQRRVHKHTTNRPFRDMLTKVWTMATHSEIDQEFVWMMDDIYIIKPTTIEQLEVPRATKWHESGLNSWQRRKKNTIRALELAGRSIHDYATHLPHVVQKENLKALYEEFHLERNTMLWEILYGNTYRGHPQSPFPFFRRIQGKMNLEDLKATTQQAHIFNHTASAWCPGVRLFLAEMFPTPAKCETEQEFRPTFKRTKAVRRPVKRRPVETHKAYIERHGK